MDKHKYNLLLAEMALNIYNMELPSDDLYKNFEDLFTLENPSNNLYYSVFIRQLSTLVSTLIKEKDLTLTEGFIDQFIEDLGVRFETVNKAFFKKYLKTSAFKLENTSAITISERIAELEACLNEGPVGNIFFETELNEMLLGFYLKDIPRSLSKIKASSEKVKELSAIREPLKAFVTIGDYYG